MGSFTLGNVQSGRDINMESTVSNSGSTEISVNYTEIAANLAGLATNDTERQQMQDLAKAMEEKDESTVSKIIDCIADNAGLLTKVCKIAFKVLL